MAVGSRLQRVGIHLYTLRREHRGCFVSRDCFLQLLEKGTVIHNQLGLALASIRMARLVCFSVVGGDGRLGSIEEPNRK
jgi:hypothetical protein